MHWGRHPPAQCMLGYTPCLLGRHPPGQTTPCPVHAGIHTPPVHAGIHSPSRHPLPSTCWDTHPTLPSACWDTPSPNGHCSGWYASYWNAFLFWDNFFFNFEFYSKIVFVEYWSQNVQYFNQKDHFISSQWDSTCNFGRFKTYKLCFIYCRGRLWVQHLSLSSGHRRNDIRWWPSTLIPWFS